MNVGEVQPAVTDARLVSGSDTHVVVSRPVDATRHQLPMDLAPPIESGVDFADADSQRVLTAAAREVARALGREAAREYFADLTRSLRDP